jgi:hypothetical protein
MLPDFSSLAPLSGCWSAKAGIQRVKPVFLRVYSVFDVMDWRGFY